MSVKYNFFKSKLYLFSAAYYFLVEKWGVLISDPLELDLKITFHRQRSTPPLEAYSNVLILKPEDIEHIIPLINVTMTLSPCTAVCERAFSAITNMS